MRVHAEGRRAVTDRRAASYAAGPGPRPGVVPAGLRGRSGPVPGPVVLTAGASACGPGDGPPNGCRSVPATMTPAATPATAVVGALATARSRALPSSASRPPAARGTAGGGDVRRGGTAEQKGREQAGEAGVDLVQLEVDRHAPPALPQMSLDPGRVPPGETVADVGAEVLLGPGAGGVRRVLGVHREEGLTQPLAGAVGQGGHRVGAEAEQRRDLGGLLALHLGVPEHQLPALGERREGPGGRGVLEALHRGVAERDAGVERASGRRSGGAAPLARIRSTWSRRTAVSR